MSVDVPRILYSAGVIDEDTLNSLIQAASDNGDSPDRIAVEKGYATEEQVLSALGEYLEIPFEGDLSGYDVPMSFVEKVPLVFSRSNNIVSFNERGGTYYVATASPFNFRSLDDAAAMLGSDIEPVFAPAKEIEDLIARGYQMRSSGLGAVLDEIDGDLQSAVSADLERAEDLLDIANKAPIIKLVSTAISEAIKRRASDIHFHPLEDKMRIRARIDGVLYDLMDSPKSIHDAVISRIKVIGKLDIAERRKPQDGRTTIKYADREIDIRISIIPTQNGERAVLRLLDKTASLRSLEELGLDKHNLDILKSVISVPHGIFFVTGPTGSGKTTTLYASLARLNSPDVNIITIEDPVEYQLRGISQIQVELKKNVSFANGLRAVLRQDPDILMVGEVRDLETAEIAIQSALTGHRVFSTIHTNDAPSAVTRLLDLGVEPFLVASSVIAVMAQRLVRRVCPHCRESYEPSDKELMSLALTRDELPDGLLYRGTGCDECLDTGYQGRVGIFELLRMDDEVRSQVMRKEDSTVIKRDAVDRGLKTLRMDGAEKVKKGLTTVDEVVRVSQMDTI
ncbi:MAG: type II secretion system ATPase GspE [Planctomycetota bacterium]|nr:type II secretion system ATPase GspE [Planctomycetota bacterium]